MSVSQTYHRGKAILCIHQNCFHCLKNCNIIITTLMAFTAIMQHHIRWFSYRPILYILLYNSTTPSLNKRDDSNV